jgi:hypothetical protein
MQKKKADDLMNIYYKYLKYTGELLAQADANVGKPMRQCHSSTS